MTDKLLEPTVSAQLDSHALLEQGRAMCLGGQSDQLQTLIPRLSQLQLNPEQALLLEVLMLYPDASTKVRTHTQLLQRAMHLHELAQALSSNLARAWIWEAMQLIQINLQLHSAALHSTAMAAEMFELCGRAQDAISLRVSRCLVMIHCEMYREVLEMSGSLLEHREQLDPMALVNLLRSTASAYYFLGNDTEGTEARSAWINSLQLHKECLQVAQQAHIDKFILISHTNIAILCASLGLREETTEHLLHVEGMQRQADHINNSWSYWIRYCEALLMCQGAEFEKGWQSLLAMAEELEKLDIRTAPVQDTVLKKIVSLGKKWEHFEIALKASERQIELNRQRRHLLSKTLGDAIDDVMAVPSLQQKNQELSQQGYALEASLARRNLELNQALAKLQTEAEIRSQAEQALQRAHTNLEEKVRQRTQELEQAMSLVMRQEKQLALSRLVVGVAHEMNTPLGNATIAASTMQFLSQNLLNDLSGPSLSRSKLQHTLHSLLEGNALLNRSLQTASELVQRFRALAVEQHQEELQTYDISYRCQLLIDEWKSRFKQGAVELRSQIQAGIQQTGYPNALFQVLDQLIDNAMRHGLQTTQQPQLEFRLHQTADDIHITLSDNGLGIAEDNLQRIFEPFFSKQLGLDGIGLGLSVAHSVITDLMHGKIQVENRPTQGLQVSLIIPKIIQARTQTSYA
nr:HAMP domain-containing sensor histidine kinase [uncultured Undibacterium sp.]